LTNIRIIPLRTWLPFLALVTYIFISALFLLHLHASYEEVLYTNSEDNIKHDMAELSRSLIDLLRDEDMLAADRILTRKASKRSYNLLIAVDPDGKVFSSTNKSLLGNSIFKLLPEFSHFNFEKSNHSGSEYLHVAKQDQLITAYFPIKSLRRPYGFDRRHLGGLYLEYDLSREVRLLWQNTWDTAKLALLTSFVLISVFYLLLNAFINRPLVHLSQITRRIASGELGIKSKLFGNGEFADLNNAINDMSQQLKANIEQLKKSEQQINEIIWASNVGTWVYDIKSGDFSINSRWEEMLGYDPGTLKLETYEDWKNLLHPDEKTILLKAFKDEASKAEGVLKFEMRLKKQNDDWAWVKCRGRVVEHDHMHKAIRISGTITNINKRKEAEANMLVRDRAIENFNVGILITDINDRDNTIIYANEHIKTITGYEPDELIGHNCRILQREDNQQTEIDIIRDAISNQQQCHVRLRNYTKDGELFWNDLKIAPVFDEYGTLTNYIAGLVDVTENKRIEERLNILRRAMESSETPVIIIDRNLMIEYVNPAFIETMGYSEEELLGKNHRLLKSDKVDLQTYNKLWERVINKGIWRGMFDNQRKDGKHFRDKCIISAVEDHSQNTTHFVCMHEDVTHEHELNKKLSYEATHDILTGLINRAEFERRADRLVKSVMGTNKIHAMCFMDLDQFKIINDTCGHTAGDDLLKQIGVLLKSITRKQDTVARLGGDEFAVLMEFCSVEQAHRVANDILNAVQDFTFVWDNRSFKLGISIGLVKIDTNVESFQVLLKQGDTACYMAKDLGRNRIHIYYTDDSEILIREGQMQWVERIYKALERDEFCFYAQPIMQTQTGLVDHYELLIRLREQDGNVIPPGAFLPAAERYNIISKIDQWSIDHIFNLLSIHKSFLDSVDCIAINLSGQSLGDIAFIEHISKLFKASNVNTRKFCFEITETSAISNLNVASDFIRQMRSLGCRFSLDDFGSGLSSFAYLKNLPVDFLKIDGLFVKDIVKDKIDLAMVRSMKDISDVMEMKTIAEFVEDDEILELLREIGVDYVQGYGIAKPRPLEEILSESSGNIIKFRR
jgi:diguanylate cyclase (GGDEF)-like protein/PAS domain S-box-containing protein